MKRFMIHAPKSIFAALVDGFIQCQYIMTTSIIQDFFRHFSQIFHSAICIFSECVIFRFFIRHFLIFERYRGALSPKKKKAEYRQRIVTIFSFCMDSFIEERFVPAVLLSAFPASLPAPAVGAQPSVRLAPRPALALSDYLPFPSHPQVKRAPPKRSAVHRE